MDVETTLEELALGLMDARDLAPNSNGRLQLLLMELEREAREALAELDRRAAEAQAAARAAGVRAKVARLRDRVLAGGRRGPAGKPDAREREQRHREGGHAPK